VVLHESATPRLPFDGARAAKRGSLRNHCATGSRSAASHVKSFRAMSGCGPGGSGNQTPARLFEFYLPHAAQDSPSFVPSVAKIQRIGHVVFTTPRYAETIDFMTRVLAFAASDDIEGVISFMRPHPNPYHHGVGVARAASGTDCIT